MDEVSVFSLLSSRVEGVAAEFTATQSNSLTAEIGGTTAANAGFAKSEVHTRAEASQSAGTQVLRKATVQSTFRELYQSIQPDLALGMPPTDLPALTADVLADAVHAGVATSVSELRRGHLIEIEVQLDAEAIFHLTTVMETFLELANELPAQLVPDIRGQLGEALAMNAVMSKLLVGLVPLRGRATGHAVVATERGEWLVDRRILPQIDGADVRELDVVAMAEAPLFWKDLRRILFGGSRYTMLCRISKDGLQDEWNPVKLADTVRRFMPDVADQLGQAQRGILEHLEPAAVAASQPNDAERMHDALRRYAGLLADHHGRDWHPSELESAARHGTGPGVEGRRPAFEAVTEQFARDTGQATARTCGRNCGRRRPRRPASDWTCPMPEARRPHTRPSGTSASWRPK